jgi:hypothetical protein
MNELIHVEAENRGGALRPTAFIWAGQRHIIRDHGRQWDENGERHFLGMTVDQRPYELVYVADVGQWRLRKSPTDLGNRPPAS